MIKAILIIVLVVAAVVGGILALRTTTRTGMPGEAVLDRAKRRAQDLDAADKHDDD
jgi:hypothetical protein